MASFLHRRVQPLKEREHYDFEFSCAEDPSHMVAALELSDEEVLERLGKMLKGVSIMPHQVVEYSTTNPPLPELGRKFVDPVSVPSVIDPAAATQTGDTRVGVYMLWRMRKVTRTTLALSISGAESAPVLRS
ncbi:uncharacterized protein [Miscanthus floridulus]|uniref:uncharacterized protein n=1 Tax=Miscanthus floridulus TaxID=154761 RepID=UPI00345855A6